MSLQPLDPSNYTKDYNFKSLKPPNLDHIVKNELPSSSDWIGYTDKKELLCSLSTTDAWSSFTTELVNTIKSCLDQAILTNKSNREGSSFKEDTENASGERRGINSSICI